MHNCHHEHNSVSGDAEKKPSRRLLIWAITVATVLFGIFAFFRFSGTGTEILWSWSNGGAWVLPLVGVAALLDSVNPCAFSVLLLTIAFLFSIGRLRSHILKIGASYIFGIFLVYILIGLGILQALHLFDTPHFMAKAGASLLIILGGINIVNDFFPTFPIKLKIPSVAHSRMGGLMEKASVPTAFALGALVGLCEFPCTGGPYLMILGLLYDQATYFSGLGYLLLYNLIFISPLVVILLLASDKLILGKVQEWKSKETRKMRLWGGAAMVALGAFIFFL